MASRHRRPRVAASSEERDISDGVRICRDREQGGVPESRQDGARRDMRARRCVGLWVGCNFAVSVLSGGEKHTNGDSRAYDTVRSNGREKREREREKRAG